MPYQGKPSNQYFCLATTRSDEMFGDTLLR
jgi:hypothetical protein